jgi:hypothetical protein
VVDLGPAYTVELREMWPISSSGAGGSQSLMLEKLSI